VRSALAQHPDEGDEGSLTVLGVTTAGYKPAPPKNKTSHRKFRGWLVVTERTDVFAMTMQANRSGCTLLNKNATDMGTPVAEVLNQKIWLNCCAETRP
jgi:hypothetical protein